VATATTDAEGLFSFGAHVIGEYSVLVEAKDADANGGGSGAR
jgi:hypothetical protein